MSIFDDILSWCIGWDRGNAYLCGWVLTIITYENSCDPMTAVVYPYCIEKTLCKYAPRCNRIVFTGVLNLMTIKIPDSGECSSALIHQVPQTR
jgi:hypothetical protein